MNKQLSNKFIRRLSIFCIFIYTVILGIGSGMSRQSCGSNYNCPDYRIGIILRTLILPSGVIAGAALVIIMQNVTSTIKNTLIRSILIFSASIAGMALVWFSILITLI